jgi:hypothetical protein
MAKQSLEVAASHAEMDRLLSQGVSKTEIARRLGVNRQRVIDRSKKVGKAAEKPVQQAEGDSTLDVSGDSATLNFVTREYVSSEEDAIRVGKVDLDMWRVDSMRLKFYQGQYVDAEGRGQIQQMCAVCLNLKRIAPRALLEAIDALFAKKELLAPKKFNRPKHKPGKVMVKFSLADVHFGKLAWGRETGQDYDLSIAEAVFENAVEDLLIEVKSKQIDCIYAMFGNDYFNADNSRNETTNGTRVECDGRQTKVIEVGMRAYIRAVERWRQEAPVKIWWIGGNHDKLNSHWGAREIKAWFRNDSGVEVDIEPRERKYATYGKTMFGMTHGEGISDSKVKELPGLMMTEAPREMITSTTRCEWILAHRHREQEFMQRGTDSHMGCTVRWMLSLSATDAWHNQKMFVGNTRAAEVLWYDKEQGFKGKALAIARAS